MIVVAVWLMIAGVWIILASADLSGSTLLGAVLFLLGLWIAQRVGDRGARTRHRDSTARALDDIAAGMVDQ